MLDAVLGPDWPRARLSPAWRAGAWRPRALTRPKLAAFGYGYSSAKEVRGEKRKGRLYDFILASRHPLAEKLFHDVTTRDCARADALFYRDG